MSIRGFKTTESRAGLQKDGVRRADDDVRVAKILPNSFDLRHAIPNLRLLEMIRQTRCRHTTSKQTTDGQISSANSISLHSHPTF